MRDASILIKRRREDIFCMGYFLDTVTDLTPDVATSTQTYGVFGSDDNMVGINVDGGSLSLTFLAKDENNNTFLDLITNQNPGDSSFKAYKWNKVTTPVSVWINRKSNDGAKYKGGILYKNWIPDPGLPAGAPTDDATRTFAGNCTAPVEIASGGIFGELLALTPSTDEVALTNTAMQISSGISGLQVIAIKDSTQSTYEVEDVPLSTNMFTGSGIVGANVLSGCVNITTFDKVYAIYAVSDNGIYPNTPFSPTSMKYRG